MRQALTRLIRAEISAHPFQIGLIFVILMLATATLTLTSTVQQSAANPWEQIFEETRGPHVWLVAENSAVDLAAVGDLPGVAQSTGVIPTSQDNPLIVDGDQHDTFLYAFPPEPLPVLRPLVVKGEWLTAESQAEIVMDYSYARWIDVAVGDTVEVLTRDGTIPLRVIGLAVTSHFVTYTARTAGLAYILPETLAQIEPDAARLAQGYGVRLEDPAAAADFIAQANTLTRSGLNTALPWEWVRDIVNLNAQFFVLLLGMIGGFALVAVGLIIANAIGGRVVADYREIGLMKAIGFRPGEISLYFLAQYLVIGLVAGVIGIGLGVLITPAFLAPTAQQLGISPEPRYDAASLIGSLLLVEMGVAFFTLIPAWQGGRVSTVQAITVGYLNRHRQPSRLARWALNAGLPPVVIVGVKDVFARPLRAVLTIAGLVLAVITAVIAVNQDVTIREQASDPMINLGTPGEVVVNRNFVPYDEAAQIIAAQPEIAAYFEGVEAFTLHPSQPDTPILVRAVGPSYSQFDFRVAEGESAIEGAEAIVSQGLLTLLDTKLGDTVTIPVYGRDLEVTLVGRNTEIYNLGNVITIPLDTYREQINPDVQPTLFTLRLNPDTDAEALKDALMTASGGQFDVQIAARVPNLEAAQLQLVVIGLLMVILMITLVNLLNTTLLGVLERSRDFGIQKTLGMTPGQVVTAVILGVAVLGLIALVIGIPFGVMLFEGMMAQIGMQLGMGPEFGLVDYAGMLWLIPGALLIVTLGAYFPARRAARTRVTEALRYE
jgi:putative ABC transport system permease protein